MLNKQAGNMYPWVTHTWNAIKGTCPHNCSYCYMHGFDVGELRLDKKTLNDNLGNNKIIFVGSSVDMWAEKVPSDWIEKVLNHCNKYPDNKYLFQSKNPKRYVEFNGKIPKNSILGTTIETNRNYPNIMMNAPMPLLRHSELSMIKGYEKFISIEPIIDFDTNCLIRWIKCIRPSFVSMGADSKGHNLPEPSPEKIKELEEELSKFTEVKEKDNLRRLQ